MRRHLDRATTWTACVAAAICALTIGCGGDDVNDNASRYEGEEAAVAAVIDDFGEAGREGDGERICEEIFTPALAQNVEREAGQSCTSEVQENLPEGEYELEVEDIDVTGDAATAEVTDEDDNRSELHFVKSGDDWRVQRVTPSP